LDRLNNFYFNLHILLWVLL